MNDVDDFWSFAPEQTYKRSQLNRKSNAWAQLRSIKDRSLTGFIIGLELRAKTMTQLTEKGKGMRGR